MREDIKEKKREVARLYLEGLKVKDIAEKMGIDKTLVSKYAIEMGCEPRIKRKPKQSKDKVCPICRHKNPSGSNFCNHCGTDIRSDEDIMIKKIESLRECISFITNKDAYEKADKITISLIQYFEGKVIQNDRARKID